MPVYRCEATLGDVEVEGGVYDGQIFFHSAGEVYFAAQEPASLRRFGMYYGWSWENIDPSGPGYYVLRTQMLPLDSASVSSPLFGDGQIIDPATSGSYFVNGTDTQQQTYKAGGTLAIEKDGAAETITFISPVGSLAIPFSELEPPTIDPEEPLLAARMGHGFLRTGGDLEHEQARWTNFRSLVADEEFHGHAMTAADPGTWSAWLDVSPASSPVGSQAGPTQTTENAQLANGYLTRFRYNTADGVRDFYARERRTLQTAIGTGYLDMATAPEHALMWEAAVAPYRTHRLRWRKSHTHGGAWEAGTIYEESGKVMESPSLSYRAGQLGVVWTFDGVVYRSHSEDAGENWSSKVVLDYSGTNPRHIMHRDHPYFLYFFFDGSDLKVARSTDSGETWIDAAPITVVVGAGPQQIDAEFSTDGSVLVGFFVAGAWNQLRSRDAGLTWE